MHTGGAGALMSCLQQLPDPRLYRIHHRPPDRARVGRRPSARSAAFTVFFEHPITRALTLISIFSALGQPTDLSPVLHGSTYFLLTSARGVRLTEGGQISPPLRGQFWGASTLQTVQAMLESATRRNDGSNGENVGQRGFLLGKSEAGSEKAEQRPTNW